MRTKFVAIVAILIFSISVFAGDNSFQRHWPEGSPFDIEILIKAADLNISPKATVYKHNALEFILQLNLFGPLTSDLNSVEQTVVEDFLSPQDIREFEVSDLVRLGEQGDQFCYFGYCEDLDKQNWDSLYSHIVGGDFRRYYHSGYTTVVQLEGQGVVGVMKDVGNGTFLALKNVANLEGKPILIRGAAYTMSTTSYREIKPQIDRTKAFRRVTLKQLVVRPGRFLDPYTFNVGFFDIPETVNAREEFRLSWRATSELLKDAAAAFDAEVDIPTYKKNCARELAKSPHASAAAGL